MPDRLFVVLVLTFAAWVGFADEALILDLSGEVSVISIGLSRPAARGETLMPGDIIITAADGKAVIILSDGNRLDLLPNSRMEVKYQNEAGNDTIFGRLWGLMKGKFAEAERVGAHVGAVGTMRGSNTEAEVLRDFNLTDTDEKVLEELLRQVDVEDLPSESADLIKGMVLEDYRQLRRAEEHYLRILEENPADIMVMDLLINLYLRNQAEVKAKEMIERKDGIITSSVPIAT